MRESIGLREVAARMTLAGEPVGHMTARAAVIDATATMIVAIARALGVRLDGPQVDAIARDDDVQHALATIIDDIRNASTEK